MSWPSQEAAEVFRHPSVMGTWAASSLVQTLTFVFLRAGGGGGPWNCKPAGFFEHSTLCERIIPLMQQHRPTKNLLSGHQQQTLQRAENSDLQAVPHFRQRQRLVIAVMFTCLWRHSHTDAGDYWQICAVPPPPPSGWVWWLPTAPKGLHSCPGAFVELGILNSVVQSHLIWPSG